VHDDGWQGARDHRRALQRRGVGDPDLAGPIVLRARSVINTTDGVGVVDGWLRINVASGRDTTAHYSAVYDHGNIAGLANGRAHDPSARLVANLSAGFSAAGGFTSGEARGRHQRRLGRRDRRVSALRLRSRRRAGRGTITALDAGSITVAGLTCAIPGDKSADVNASSRSTTGLRSTAASSPATTP
jgi:hypothetical protein